MVSSSRSIDITLETLSRVPLHSKEARLNQETSHRHHTASPYAPPETPPPPPSSSALPRTPRAASVSCPVSSSPTSRRRNRRSRSPSSAALETRCRLWSMRGLLRVTDLTGALGVLGMSIVTAAARHCCWRERRSRRLLWGGRQSH